MAVTAFLKMTIESNVWMVDFEAPTTTLVSGLVYFISMKVAVESEWELWQWEGENEELKGERAYQCWSKSLTTPTTTTCTKRSEGFWARRREHLPDPPTLSWRKTWWQWRGWCCSAREPTRYFWAALVSFSQRYLRPVSKGRSRGRERNCVREEREREEGAYHAVPQTGMKQHPTAGQPKKNLLLP